MASNQPEPSNPNTPTALPSRPVAVKPEPMEMDERGLYRVSNQMDELRVAKMLIESGAVNKTLRNPMHVMVAMQTAKSVGLNPYTALRQMAFINGSLTFYGDLELAIVRMSGQLENFHEFTFLLNEEGKYEKRSFENNNLHLPAFGAFCRVQRKGFDPCEEAFTEADAKTAGLWKKTNVWSSYPQRMMCMRARSVNLKRVFPDILQGVSSIEYEYEGVDRT